MVMITPYNLLRQELIGLHAEIVDFKDKKQIGFEGLIVDETRNTLVLEHRNRKRTIVKEDVTLSIHTESGVRALVNGSLLLGRPEERIKKKFRIRF